METFSGQFSEPTETGESASCGCVGIFFWPALVIMLQHMLADRRLGGEVVFLVEPWERFVFQIIPLLDTTVTGGGGIC